jgi:hypothetical protein
MKLLFLDEGPSGAAVSESANLPRYASSAGYPSEHRKRLLSERQAIVEHHGKVLGAENGDDE